MDVGNGRLLAYLAAHGEDLSKKYLGERVSVHCRMSANLLGRIQEDGVVVRQRRPTEAQSKEDGES